MFVECRKFTLKSMSEELLKCILLVFFFLGFGIAVLTKAVCQYLVFQFDIGFFVLM